VHHPLQRFIKVALCSEEEGSSANQRLDPLDIRQGITTETLVNLWLKEKLTRVS